MITVNNLHFRYGKKTIFSNLNIAFQHGTICGLLGKNGTGKSTLLKLISGLLFADSGSIQTMGFSPKERHPDALKQLYFIPEEFNLPDVNTDDLITYYSPFYPNFSKSLYASYIKEFEVPQKQRFSEMSLGQKKKAVISFGLACKTPLLLMDEPTNGLDIISKSQFQNVMQSVYDPNQVILISSHQAKDLENIINQICIIEEQGILLNETKDNILKKLSFHSGSASAPESSLFIDSEHGGVRSFIATAKQGSASNYLNLELLFKAVVSDPTFAKTHIQTTHE